MRAFFVRFRRAAVFCLLVLFLTAGAVPRASAADKYMEGWGAEISILLDEAGGAAVTESWDCYFGGDTITRYRRHYRSPDPELCQLEIREVRMDGTEMELLDAPDESRPEGSAAVYGDEDGSLHIEMYLNALDELHNFEITYYMPNAVEVFEDVADFHYTLTSENESFDLDGLDAVIELPSPVEVGGISFWAHTPDESATFDGEEESDGLVRSFRLHAEDIPRDEAVTVRFAMPTELFPDSTRVYDEMMLDTILEEEYTVQEDDSEEEENPYEDDVVVSEPVGFFYNLGEFFGMIRSIIMDIWFVVVLIIGGVPTVLGLIIAGVAQHHMDSKVLPELYARRRLKPVSAPRYCTTLPDDMKPAMVRKLMMVYPEGQKEVKGGNHFSATLLSLVESGLIDSTRSGEGEVTYQVSARAAEADLTEYESILVDMFLTAGAGKAPMTTTEITGYMRSNYSWCKEQYKAFNEAVDRAFDQLGLTVFEPGESIDIRKQHRFAILYGVLLFLGTYHGWGLIGGALSAVVMALMGSSALFTVWDIMHPSLTFLTQEGENRYAQWTAYSNYLRDFTNVEDKGVDDLGVWRKYLVYAVALGCSVQLVDSLRFAVPALYERFVDDSYLSGYEDMYRSVSDIDREGSYVEHSSGSSGGSSSDGWDGDSDDWGGCSDSCGDSDSGSSGSDFD